MISRLYVNEDNDIVLDGLKKSVADTYVNDATVTFQVTDSAGTVMVSPTAMSYIADSDGKYWGVIDKADAASFADGTSYSVECTVTSGTFDGYRKVILKAQYHGAV